MNNMKFGTRLGLAFGLVFVLLIGIACVGIVRVGTINDELKLMVEDRFPKTVWANDIIDAVNIAARAQRNIALLKNEADVALLERLAFMNRRETEQ